MAGDVSGAPLSWLERQADAMTRMLADLVNIDSGSGDRDGIERVGTVIERFLEKHAIRTERLEEKAGLIIHASLPSAKTASGGWLLMGHMDTVFPSGTAARRPFRIDNGRAFGPGVADMKSGLVMNCFALAALAQSGIETPRVAALFTCDEEVASPVSRPFIEERARTADYALNAEPGRVNGDIVVERKAGLFLTVEVYGKAAHAGVDFESGASAIDELANKINALRALSDHSTGVTLNVGLISGGETVNTVAPRASARIDLRYVSVTQRQGLIDRIRRIVDTCEVPGTRGDFHIDGEFPPMTPDSHTYAMLTTYREAAAGVGFAVGGTKTGGCSDAGFTAALGVPTLCGVGPVGGHAHTDEEYCDLASLVPRAQALVATILGHTARSLGPVASEKAQDGAPEATASRSDQW